MHVPMLAQTVRLHVCLPAAGVERLLMSTAAVILVIVVATTAMAAAVVETTVGIRCCGGCCSGFDGLSTAEPSPQSKVALTVPPFFGRWLAAFSLTQALTYSVMHAWLPSMPYSSCSLAPHTKASAPPLSRTTTPQQTPPT